MMAAALELSQQSLTRGAGTGAARRAPSHCRQCSGPWQRWQQRSQYCAAELSLAQAASYASCDAAVTAALEPHWRSVRTSARASAAGGQHQGPGRGRLAVPRRCANLRSRENQGTSAAERSRRGAHFFTIDENPLDRGNYKIRLMH